MYQQNPYSYGYGAYQQTYYPIANQGWNGNQQVSQQIPQRPMTFSQQSNLYEKVNGFEEVRSYHMPSGAQKLLEHNGDIYSCDDLCVTCYSNLLSGVFRLTRRNGMKKTIGQISEDFPNNTLLLRTDGHLSCSINGIVYDIWDCTNEVCDVFWIVD